MLLTLSFLHMWRERYYPEFKIMALALFLAVFSITILISLSQVLQQSVNKDASKLLGADLVVESSDPLPKTFEQYAQKHFTTALVVDFFSMIQARENSLLVDVSAIDGDTFPLRGELKVKKDNQIFISHQAVAPGHIWLEESLAIKLGVHEKEQVMIGDASFNIDGLLMERPIALSSSSVLAPVVYVNAKDLAKMAVLQPGSRATYRLLLVGSQDSLLALKKQFHHVSNITWITANEGRPAVSRLLVYSQRYLSVIILIQIILAGIAIALCSHQYSLRQQRNMALFKSFGASNNLILSLQFLCMCMLALFVLVFAIITAYAICFGILTSSHFSYLGAKMNWQGAAFGGASGLLILLGFGLGPLWRLKQVSPLQLLQQQAQVRGKFNSLPSVIAVILLIILYQFYFQEPLFALSIAGQIAGVSAIAFAMGYLLWNLFGELSKRTPIAWRFAISYMVRYKSSSIIQWFVFMIVIMLLLLVQIIQHDFISSWKSQLSENTPNYFLLNIQASQVGELKEWFNENQIENVNFYPIVRGRMSHINGKSIDEINLGAKEKKGLGRSINLTWMITLPQDNRVIKGVNWGTVPENEHVISIEEQFAQRQ
ncbi:MAG: ABC transporter permease, partial [Candidatus Berkiella sp.]